MRYWADACNHERWPESFWKVASLRVRGVIGAQRFQSIGAVGVVELADDGESG